MPSLGASVTYIGNLGYPQLHPVFEELARKAQVISVGEPAHTDALEFDDELATVDTLYDLAFLLMDLDIRGQRAAANAVLNRYLWRSGAEPDLRGLQALPLFLGLRSTIRAMVTAERAVQETAEAQIRDRNEAGRYLDAATAYLAPPVPQLVAVGGLSGTGKSTLASGLAPTIAGALIFETADGKLGGYPAVGLVSAGAAAIALVLAGRLKPVPQHMTEPAAVESKAEERDREPVTAV